MAENVSIVIKAFDKTKPAFGAVGKSLKGVTSAIFSMRTALVGVAGVAGFGYLVKSSLNATDTLSKTANKIGTTTEALGGLRYAAEVTGVATNTMDMALQRFTRRTAEAAKGTGEAKGAIKELGLNAQELNKMPLDQRMIALADAFGKVDNESDQLRLAFKLFDSEGAALVNTLALGSDGLKDLLGEAKLLGLTMSTTAAQGVEKANDSITKLLYLAKGLKDQFAAALAPAIEGLVTLLTGRLQDSIKKAGGTVEAFAKNMAISFIGATAGIVKGFESMMKVIDRALNFVAAKVNNFQLRGFQAELAEAQNKAKLFGDAYNTMIRGGKLSGKDTLKLGLYGVERNTEALFKAWDLADKKIQASHVSINSLTVKPFNLAGMFDVEDFSYAEFAEGLIASLGEVGGAAEKALEPTTKALSDVQQGFKDWSDALPDTTANIKSLTNQGLNGLTDALTAGVTGAANFADAMKSMAKSVIDSLIKMLIQKYIVDAAFGAITGFIGNTQTGINSAAGYGSSLGGADPFNTSNFSGKAIGGSVQSGQPYMVGERGPEMFVPNSQGSIVPNGRLGGANSLDTSNFAPRAIGGSVQNGSPYMVGERGPEMFVPNSQGSIVPNNRMGGDGITINQTINVTTGVQQTVRAEIASLMPQIANAAKGAVADAKMRGGNYSKMLGA